jgi:predicted KAP-like P-loop ATPase
MLIGEKMELDKENLKFISDRPASREEDFLNRRGFAKKLAKRLLDFKDQECLIVGVNGPWGSGKTTFLGYLESQLIGEGKDVIIVRFNPWNFSTVDQLIAMFFNELKLAIRRGKGSRDIALKIGKGLDTLSKILSPFETAGGLFALPYGLMMPSNMSSIFEKAGLTIKELAEQDPSELKTELNNLLAEFDKKLIIFVDDLDRLDKESLRLMFRLIRLNADFRNTIYILSFDREIVEKALNEVQSGDGREYLEKFIQVPFDLPLPEHNKIIKILMERIGKILPASAHNELKSYRWVKMNNEFNSFFRTIRDVKRYINGLLLTLPSIDQETDYLDFLALEAIRIFEPYVYSKIVDNRELLLGNSPPFRVNLSSGEIDRRKKMIDDIIKIANGDHQSAVKDIISNLFPHAGEAASNGYRSQYRKEKRICSSYRFDNYFLLALPEGEISQEDINNALNSIHDKISFIRIIDEYIDQGIVIQLLNRIPDYTNDIPLEHINNIIITLFDKGDEIIKFPNNEISYDAEIKIGHIILDLIERIDAPDKRAKALTYCIENTKGFCIPVYASFLINREIKRNIEFLPNEGFQAIKSLIAEKIRKEALNDDFIRRPNAGGILYRWEEVSDISEPKEFVSRLIMDDSGLVKLLTMFLAKSGSIMESECRYSFNDGSLESLSKFVDPSSISPRVISIKQTRPDLINNELENIAVNGFTEVYENHVQVR